MAGSIPSASDYDAALWGSAVAIRRERRFFRVYGKAPGEMLNGLITNSPPARPTTIDGGRAHGSVVYSAILTAKGRMITDLRLFWNGDDAFLLELPDVGVAATVAHFKKFLPPRLAKVEDQSEAWTTLTVLGPEAPAMLARVLDLSQTGFGADDMDGLREDEDVAFPGSAFGPFRMTGNGEAHGKGWDLVLPAARGAALREALDREGAVPLSESTLEILRVERGRPAFGRDMDDDILPMEAGITSRAIDNDKGCYAGQEVVIRIRDRGHVNKELRGFLLGDVKLPRRGTELFQPEREKSAGWITTPVSSPAMGQAIALGYARRGVEPGMILRVGSQDGPEAQVRGLGEAGWILD